jgi:ABC-type Mn2+/Zn2+ transport system ATPase subunit
MRTVPGAIIARGLAAGYAGNLVWSDATFEIESGSFVALLGPNGAASQLSSGCCWGCYPRRPGAEAANVQHHSAARGWTEVPERDWPGPLSATK